MKNALTVRSPAARRRIRAERQAAKETDRASGYLFNELIDILMKNPNWNGGQIVKGGGK